MVTFINREEEKEVIRESLQALRDYKHVLLRTPIIDFHGIDGIGKTSIVQHIEGLCEQAHIPYIRIAANKTAQEFSQSVIQQVRRYNKFFSDEQPDTSSLQQSIIAIKDLLKRGVVVMLLDAVDPLNRELIDRIANTLSEVIDENKLFVVLTSRKVLAFESARTVARKLSSIALKPFDQKSCADYLDEVGTPPNREVRDYIYDWTRGYPLAIEVMTNAIIQQGLDPRIAANQQPLMEQIFHQVIEEKVLAHLKPSLRDKYQTALLLLAIPRRFNVVIMQELIERFEPTLKRESSIAYINLSQEIIRETGILSWNMLKAGFSIDAPVRHIYLLKSKIEQDGRYLEIHRFLASLNKQLADTIPGTDHILYMREYLYHSAFTVEPLEMSRILEQAVQQIIKESPILFEQFYEEFSQDKDFQEQLSSEQTLKVHSLLYQHRAQTNLQLARQGTNTERFLREFFYYTLKDPHILDQRSHLDQLLHKLNEEDVQIFSAQLFATLAEDEEFKTALGQHAELFSSLVQQLLEGEH
ncbi:hypothetical protein KSF_066490 [Reticulibacter mediterranei]|uniref:NB-ARC domain-containing protein n=1 Tax=Reticulibacter mediterranei TaxID=2778369 RepID=A0A8J3IUT6_9CHLR|nr:NB-ARC domain-containing protein [Reticulibacter mediterranei]GHO96601.1 hypothetical protein KSF_066490 [Reticulibacter mediterranei]